MTKLLFHQMPIFSLYGNFSQSSIFESKELIYESSRQGQLQVAETELSFFSAITNNVT